MKIYGDPNAVKRAKELIQELTVDRIKFFHPNEVQPTVEEKKPVIVDWQKFLKECVRKIEANIFCHLLSKSKKYYVQTFVG